MVRVARTLSSDLRRRDEVLEMGDIGGPWASQANTPMRTSSPGRLGDDPVVGPPSLLRQEERLLGWTPEQGWSFGEFREGFRQLLEEDDVVAELVALHLDS